VHGCGNTKRVFRSVCVCSHDNRMLSVDLMQMRAHIVLSIVQITWMYIFCAIYLNYMHEYYSFVSGQVLF